MRPVPVALISSVLFLVAFAGCDSDDAILSGEGENCTKTADCESGLKCVGFVCMPESKTGETPSPEDSEGSGGIWLDVESGMMWHNPAFDVYLSQLEAIYFCQDSEVGRYTDWRLPTISELRSLVIGCPATVVGGGCGVTDECLGGSCFEPDVCGGCPDGEGPAPHGCYWSEQLHGYCGVYMSSSPIDYDWDAWYLDFDEAQLGNTEKLLTPKGHVRCVR